MNKPTDNTQGLDEILRLVYEAGYLDGSKPEDYRDRLDKVMQIKPAKQAILQWVNDEVIGEDTVTKDSNGSLGFTEKDLNQN